MDIRKLFDPMFDRLADHIDQTRDDNDLRYEYWKVMSRSKWANKDFEKLVDGALDYLLLDSVNYRKGESIDKVMDDIVERWVLMDISDWAVSDPEIKRELPADILRKCQQTADDLSYIKRDIEDMYRREEDQTRGRDRDRERSRTLLDGGRGRESESRDLLGNRGRGRGRSTGSSGRGREEESRRPASGLSAVLDKKETGTDQRAEDRESLGRSRRGEVEPQREASVREEIDAPVRQTRLDGPDYTLARPFDEFWINDECWRPAHISGWTVQPDEGEFAAIETAFNPRKKMRFHVKNFKNVVREELKDMSKDMDYMRHELASRGRVRQTDKTDPRYTPVEKEGYVSPSSLPDEFVPIIQAARGQIDLLNTKILSISSIEEGEMLAQFELRKVGVNQAVFNFAVNTPMLVNRMENLEQLREVANSINLTDAATRMNKIINDVDPGVWEFVNRRMTKVVNAVVRNHYGMGVGIDDFAADYEKLITWMKQRDEMLARNFSLYTRFIPLAVCAEPDEEEYQQLLCALLGLSDEEYNQRRPDAICFVEYRTLILADFTLGDMGIVLTSKSQKLDSLEYPMLHTFLEKALLINEEGPDNATLYLLTRDRYRVEVIRSPLDKDQLLLRLMDSNGV